MRSHKVPGDGCSRCPASSTLLHGARDHAPPNREQRSVCAGRRAPLHTRPGLTSAVPSTREQRGHSAGRGDAGAGTQEHPAPPARASRRGHRRLRLEGPVSPSGACAVPQTTRRGAPEGGQHSLPDEPSSGSRTETAEGRGRLAALPEAAAGTGPEGLRDGCRLGGGGGTRGPPRGCGGQPRWPGVRPGLACEGQVWRPGDPRVAHTPRASASLETRLLRPGRHRLGWQVALVRGGVSPQRQRPALHDTPQDACQGPAQTLSRGERQVAAGGVSWRRPPAPGVRGTAPGTVCARGRVPSAGVTATPGPGRRPHVLPGAQGPRRGPPCRRGS